MESVTFNCRQNNSFPRVAADGVYLWDPINDSLLTNSEKRSCTQGNPPTKINNVGIEAGDIHASCSNPILAYEGYQVDIDGDNVKTCAAIVGWVYEGETAWNDWGENDIDCESETMTNCAVFDVQASC